MTAELIAEADKGEIHIGSDISTAHKEDQLEEIDPVLEKKVLRKTDWHLIPILFLLQLCSFIDRYVLPRLKGLSTRLTTKQDQHWQCSNSGARERSAYDGQ